VILIVIQLEKLLQKNYYLHQSAKDGFRAYLQAYASYSLKKIYNVHALDLAKVGKAFGFAVPPRVNIKMGGSSEEARGKKRRRGAGSDDDGDDNAEEQSGMDEGSNGSRRERKGSSGTHRRIESMGSKKVKKEMYKVAKDRARNDGKSSSNAQWTR
jgi:ATP-dependent RNA helicase DDX18/HAS1